MLNSRSLQAMEQKWLRTGFASEYAMYGSAKFSFDMTKSWINIGETEGRVRVLDSSGSCSG